MDPSRKGAIATKETAVKPASIEEVVAAIVPLMRGFKGDWCVAGGWAVDLFLGGVTRPHQELELAIIRQDQMSPRNHLHGWKFEETVNGRMMPWAADEELKHPIHEIHARSSRDPLMSLEFLLNERIDYEWVYRRDK